MTCGGWATMSTIIMIQTWLCKWLWEGLKWHEECWALSMWFKSQALFMVSWEGRTFGRCWSLGMSSRGVGGFMLGIKVLGSLGTRGRIMHHTNCLFDGMSLITNTEGIAKCASFNQASDQSKNGHVDNHQNGKMFDKREVQHCCHHHNWWMRAWWSNERLGLYHHKHRVCLRGLY